MNNEDLTEREMKLVEQDKKVLEIYVSRMKSILREYGYRTKKIVTVVEVLHDHLKRNDASRVKKTAGCRVLYFEVCISVFCAKLVSNILNRIGFSYKKNTVN